MSLSNSKSILQKITSRFTGGYSCNKIAVAVSGGCDSVALLMLLHQWCRMRKVEICVFHVDHSLRKSSDDDKKWVEQLSYRLGIDFFYQKATEADKNNNDTPHKEGSEAWARWFRHKSFVLMQKESGADIITTGHTADDQTETILMRLLRGCGIAGAIGIKSRITLNTDFGKLKIWRPLLKTERKLLKNYLESIEQSWREDETNRNEAFFRNKIRLSILPVIKNSADKISLHITEFATELENIHLYLRKKARIFLNKFQSDNSLKIVKKPMKALRLEIIRQWLITQDIDQNIERSLILRIDELWEQKKSGRKVIAQKREFCRIKDKIVVRLLV